MNTQAARRSTKAGLCALALICIAPAPAAHAGGAGIGFRSHVNKGDTVGITVEMGGFRDELCQPTISKGARSEKGPEVETGRDAGARWSWLVPGNIAGGRWHFAVTCSGGVRVKHAETAFLVSAGIGPRADGLWLLHSMHHESARLQPPGEGNGSGGGALYPFGQCTWWIARKRPDLPYFSGASGDALNWAKSAAAAGFPVGEIPTLGAVAVFAPGQYGAGRYGHVAYVTAISGSDITISEANFRGHLRHDTRTIPASGLTFIYRKGQPPAAPTIELRNPLPESIVSGAVGLSAVSDAPRVLFQAYYYTEPAHHFSGHLATIAEDTTSADGFSATWQSAAVPNQGGPGGSSVVLSATALDAAGRPTSASAAVRVNLANSRTEAGVTYYPYYVVGTCEEGECGLHFRSGPGYSEYPTTGERFDDEELDVVCQAHGENFTSPRTGTSSDIWDQLTNGQWVTDYYVDTPGRGVLSPPLPLCP